MASWLETHFRLHRRKNPIPRAIPSRSGYHQIFSICSLNSDRNTRKSHRSHRSSTPAGQVSCLLHRQANEEVELCSVSRQNPFRAVADLIRTKIFSSWSGMSLREIGESLPQTEMTSRALDNAARWVFRKGGDSVLDKTFAFYSKDSARVSRS